MKKYILTAIIAILAGVNTAWGQEITKPITATDIEIIAQATYRGTAFTPEEIKNNWIHVWLRQDELSELTMGTDYTVTVVEGTYLNAATYENAITITGMGNYSDTRNINFTISQKAITATDITITPSAGNSSIEYDGSEHSPSFIVTDGETPLVLDTDYELDDSEGYTASAIAPGTYTTRIKGRGNYTGTISTEYEWKVAACATITRSGTTLYYGSLKDAIDDAQDGETIEIVNDGPMGGNITITGKTVTIVGEGVITSAVDEYIQIGADGVLNLGQEGVTTTDITFDGNNVYRNCLIDLASGTLNMYGGITIQHVNLSGLAVVKYTGNNSVFNMYGGSIKDCCKLGASYCLVGVESGTGSAFNLSGGEVIAPEEVYYTLLVYGNDTSLDFTMTGGTIEANQLLVSGTYAVSVYYYQNTSGQVNISGGTINGMTAKSSSATVAYSATGGTFNWPCGSIVAEDYVAHKDDVADGDPQTWTVILGTAKNATRAYESFAEAASNTTDSDDIVTLLQDIANTDTYELTTTQPVLKVKKGTRTMADSNVTAPEGYLVTVSTDTETGITTYSMDVAPVQLIHTNDDSDYFATLAEALDEVEENETVKLLANVSLDADCEPSLTSGTFMLDINGMEIVDRGFNILLATDQSVMTSQQTNIFAPQDAVNYVVVRESNTGNQDFPYTYSVKMNIASPNITVTVSPVVYDGRQHEVSEDDVRVTVVNNTTTLEAGDDYTISLIPTGNYDLDDFDNAEENVYKYARTYANAIVIEGIADAGFAGRRTVDLVITPRSIHDVTVSGNVLTCKTGGYDEQEVADAVSLQYNGVALIKDTDYEITVADGTYTDVGVYSNVITLTGKEGGNFTGTMSVDLTLMKELDGDFAADFTVSPSPLVIINGVTDMDEFPKTIGVYDNGKRLTLGVDYQITCAYANPEDAVKGTLTVIGQGLYSESKVFDLYVVNEYFHNGDFDYHALTGSTLAVGNATHSAVTTLTGAIAIPEEVSLLNGELVMTVTTIEQGAFKDCTGVTGLNLFNVHTITEVENGAFEGCTALRYIDLANAKGFTPKSLERNSKVAAAPFYGVPKQALVYLNGTSFKGENYVYKPGDGRDYFCELFKVYDDMSGSQTSFSEDDGYKWAFENRHNFTAYAVENTRMMTVGKHYTTCLPYDLDITDTFKAYTLDATSDKLFGFREVTGTLTKYTPYVIVPTANGQLLSTAHNAVVQELKDEGQGVLERNKVEAGDYTMYPCMRYTDKADAQGKYIMQYNGGNPTWMQISSATASFNPGPDRSCILPMRAYIVGAPSAPDPARQNARMGLSLTDIDGSTMTFDLDQLDLAPDNSLYDLQGRKLQTPQRKGVYIINGKKVVMK